jgi:hypothetical protein
MTDGGAGLRGSWRLVSAQFEPDGAPSFDMYGPNAEGRLVVGPDYLSVIITMTAAEGAMPNVLAYSGRYRVEDGRRLVTSVDLASMPPWVGTEQAREIAVESDKLSLRTATGPHPAAPGKVGSGILTFKREA